MRSASIWLALAMTTAALSGCFDDDDEEAGAFETSPADDTNDPGAGGGASANATFDVGNETMPPSSPTNTTGDGNDTEDGGMETHEENRSGTASSFNFFGLTDESTTEDFEVMEGAVTLDLSVNATGGDLAVCVLPPGAEECAAEFEAAEGEGGSGSVSGPEPGTWTVELAPQGMGDQSVDYEIIFSQTVAGGSGNETGSPGGPGETGGPGEPTGGPTGEPTPSSEPTPTTSG